MQVVLPLLSLHCPPLLSLPWYLVLSTCTCTCVFGTCNIYGILHATLLKKVHFSDQPNMCIIQFSLFWSSFCTRLNMCIIDVYCKSLVVLLCSETTFKRQLCSKLSSILHTQGRINLQGARCHATMEGFGSFASTAMLAFVRHLKSIRIVL